MPNFNYMTVEETRKAAKEKWDRDTKAKIKKVSKEPAVKNNSKAKHG